MTRRLAEYAARAGVPRVSFHDLRKIFTTEFLRAGGSPKQTQYWLGRTTSKLVLEVYGGLQVELDLAEAELNIDELTGINDD